MLASAELAQDFTILNQQYRKLIEALLEVVSMPGTPIEVPVTERGNFRGFDATQFYVVVRGSLAARSVRSSSPRRGCTRCGVG